MKTYFADVHIHIGFTAAGKPVKITGAKSLTLTNILKEAAYKKGLDIIGIIDCHVPEVIQEIEQLMAQSSSLEYKEGGLRIHDVTLLLGSEIEIYDDNCQGPIHVLVFLPHIEQMKTFTAWLSQRMKNISLSSQRVYETGKKLQEVVKQLGGLFIPAHVFTPFKSLYGKGVVKSLEEVFYPEKIDAIELGLSADTEMALQIPELHNYAFLSNSDAHSLAKIAREYQKLQLKKPTFHEFKLALKRKGGRGVLTNYGLNPRLGKYYRTTCERCFAIHDQRAAKCSNCGHDQFTKGVYERLQELKECTSMKSVRPPYIHQVPLEYIPGVGPKTMAKLRDHFQTEMNILHHVSFAELKNALPEKIARMILQARKGRLALQAGGGGKYGKVKAYE